MAIIQGNSVLIWNFQGIPLGVTTARPSTGECVPGLIQNIKADGVTIDAVCFPPGCSIPQIVYGISPTSSVTVGNPVSYTLV